MNIKINTICFILLLLFLINAVNAVDSNNETLTNINQPIENICQVSPDKYDELIVKSENSNHLESGAVKPSAATKQKVTIAAPNVKMHYKDGSKFTVCVKNKNKAIKNAKIKITINGRTYSKTTDSNGKATLPLALKSGTYTAITTFDETNMYQKQRVKSTVVIKSTVRCSDFTKYYKNTAPYYSTFYDKKGKALKNTAVKFKINNKFYCVKTDSKGIGKLNINLVPGKYSIYCLNSKTSEITAKVITIKSLIETKDLTMNESDGSKFSVKVLNSYGKASCNKKVTLKVNGNTYTIKTDSRGIAALPIDFDEGKYHITTEYEGLKNTNQITINKAVKKTPFSHITSIPNYVNVTIPYAFYNSAYTLKTGINGTVKMPKIEVFTIEIASKVIRFATGPNNIGDVITMEDKSYLILFNGYGMMTSYNKDELRGEGIIITKKAESTEIEYKDLTGENIELFGFYADKNVDNSETFTYLKNDKVMARVTLQTHHYDEMGVKYSLAKLYQRVNLDFNYYEITNHVANPVVFTNTGKPVTYSYYTNFIVGYPTREDIITSFKINSNDEPAREEQITYGRGEKYRPAFGFEVLQTYCIINEKVTHPIMEKWVNKNSAYANRFGVMNIYGMFLASLETAWIADEMADKYAGEFNVSWKRGNAVTIQGGINLRDTYLHILNSDMGMVTSGNGENVTLFRFINSLNLANIEDYSLEAVANRYDNTTTNSLDNVLYSIANNTFSITQLGELMYVFNGNDSAIVLNLTSGVSSVLISNDDTVYKGSRINTKEDCCSVCNLFNDILNRVKTTMTKFQSGFSAITDSLNKLHPLSILAYFGVKKLLGTMLSGASSVAFGLFNTMALVQAAGVTYRTGYIDEKDWYAVMDTYTFTRPGYLQGKKVYNIPNEDGGSDYVEVPINPDLTLDRNNVKYICHGNTRLLNKQETYQYFSDDYWSPFSLPTKYWDESWKNII